MLIGSERKAFWVLFLALWALYAAIPQRGPQLSLVGAELENIVERGRLHFVEGEMIGPARFLNTETRTESCGVVLKHFTPGGLLRGQQPTPRGHIEFHSVDERFAAHRPRLDVAEDRDDVLRAHLEPHKALRSRR